MNRQVKCKFAKEVLFVTILIALGFVFATGIALGQSTEAYRRNDFKTSESGGQSDHTVDPEIIKELERMRSRIEELEALLKSRSGDASKTSDKTNQGQKAEPSTNQLANSDSETTAQSSSQTKPPKAEPFAFADFTWLNGNPRTKTPAFDSKFFTPEIRADVDYIYDFAHPKDDTISGSSEVFRSNEVQMTQLGVGGDFHYDNVREGKVHAGLRPRYSSAIRKLDIDVSIPNAT